MTAFYSPAPRPRNEAERQRAVDRSGFLEAEGDSELTAIIREAAVLFGTPIAVIAIIDHDRQFFPVRLGTDLSETPRAASFSAHAMLDPGRPFCVLDASQDKRFAGNPFVLSGPEIRFYAGAPLVDEDDQPLGALCVLDRERGEPPSMAQLDALGVLAARAMLRVAALKA